ncbi:MAG: lipopolysaccharide assembly protein LapA domain-containing protein [bacterium]|nr:lipopolysaccharide assembly protein LapA domain-containing protein [bacterium]
MHIIKILLIVAIIILSVDFLRQNDWIVKQSYQIQYYRYQSVEIPMILLLLGGVFFGALMVSVPSFIKNFHLRRALRAERRRCSQMEKELNSLRNLPITDEKSIEQIGKNT